MRIILPAALAGVLLAVAPALAQSTATPPSAENGRYTFNQIDGGMLRLDTQTGEVSRCAKAETGWSCQPVPDERAALEREIARLQQENAALKKDMLAHGLPLPGAVTAEKDKNKSEDGLRLPSDADLDRMMAFFEKMWRRLVGMVGNMQKDLGEKI